MGKENSKIEELKFQLLHGKFKYLRRFKDRQSVNETDSQQLPHISNFSAKFKYAFYIL